MENIVVSETLAIAVVVISGFIVNRAAALAGLKLSELAKKLVVFVLATAAAGYAAYQGYVPVAGDDPLALAVSLVANAGFIFKAAQPVYDRAWKALLAAE